MTDYRIVSDGTPAGTRVFGPGGREVKYVRSVTWAIDADGTTSAHLEVLASIEATVPQDQVTASHGRPPVDIAVDPGLLSTDERGERRPPKEGLPMKRGSHPT